MRQIWTWLRKLLKPMPLAIVVCFGLAAIVWLYGEKLGAYGVYPGKDPLVRKWVSLGLLSLGILLVLVLAVGAFRKWLASRASKTVQEPTSEEIETQTLAKVFERVCDVMRRRWSEEGNPVFVLPWYLVLGPSGSGKTTLIENSDLRLPIDHEIRAALADLKETEAARFAEWRVAGSDAVLIELAGGFSFGNEERSSLQTLLWQRFLAELQIVRPRRPLNGVVLTIDIIDFAEMDSSGRDAFATKVRRILDDIVESLATRMTIHVVFTKLDQIAGFLDFFHEIDVEERESLLGFQFTAEGGQPWLEQFDTQYSEFLERLHRFLGLRMKALKDTNRRQEAFTFVRSFVGIRKSLRIFLESALQADRFSTPPLFRGVYFTAPRLENAPHNIFLETVAERYNLPAPLYAVPQGASKPYFASRILKEAVFREAGLAGNNRRAEERYTRTATALTLIVTLVALSASVYWFAQYRKNIARANAVYARIADLQAHPGSGQDTMRQLDTFRAAMLEFGDYRAVNPVIAEMSLYKGREVALLADEAYRTVLHNSFLPSLINKLEGKLANVCPRGSDEQLNLLRILLMLGTPERRNLPAIESHFRAGWQAAYPNNAAVQTQLTDHLRYALTVDPQPYKIDAGLVRSVRRDLARVTPYRRLYASLRGLADRQLPNPLELRAAVGATFDIVYVADENAESGSSAASLSDDASANCTAPSTVQRDPFEIERIYTKDQFHNFFLPQMQAVSRAALEDLWTLGISEKAETSEADLDIMRQKLREIYVEDYIRAWRKALKAMKVRSFADLRDADEILRGITGVDSPIRRIATLVTDNTVIYAPEAVTPDMPAGATELLFDPNREAGLRINEEFRAIHRLLTGEQSTVQPNIDQIEEALADLHDYMKALRDAPDPYAKALEVATARANLKGSDPIYLMDRLAERMPAPFDAHLHYIASESWRVILGAAAVELNRKWGKDVYAEFERLIANRYPFDRKSQDDLPLQDFEDFFKPGGTLESFYKANLATFVDEASGQPRDIDGQSLPIDPAFASQLQRAVRITRTFFNDAGELSVRFSVQPMGMSANLARAQLNFEGQIVVSTHSATRSVKIVWPNSIDGDASSRFDLSALGSGKSGGRQFNGPWSWLRMYDSGTKAGISENSVDVSFGNASGQSARFRIWTEGQINPFFNSPLSSFMLPNELRRTAPSQ